MLLGTAVLIIWKQTGLGAQMYEIVPGFLVNSATIFVVNIFYKQDNREVIEEYSRVNEFFVENNI